MNSPIVLLAIALLSRTSVIEGVICLGPFNEYEKSAVGNAGVPFQIDRSRQCVRVQYVHTNEVALVQRNAACDSTMAGVNVFHFQIRQFAYSTDSMEKTRFFFFFFFFFREHWAFLLLVDDYFGVLLGKSYLLDWKRETTFRQGALGRRGLAVSAVNAAINDTTVRDLWTHTGNISELMRARTLGDVGWETARTYNVSIVNTQTLTPLFIWIDGVLEFDLPAPRPDGWPSQFGVAFYANSQSYVEYCDMPNCDVSTVCDAPLTTTGPTLPVCMINNREFHSHSLHGLAPKTVRRSRRCLAVTETTIDDVVVIHSMAREDRTRSTFKERFALDITQLGHSNERSFFGVALGFNADSAPTDRRSFIVLDWKGRTESLYDNVAESRITVSVVRIVDRDANGEPPTLLDYWPRSPDGYVVRTVNQTNLRLWTPGETYRWDVFYSATAFKFWLDGELLFDMGVIDNTTDSNTLSWPALWTMQSFVEWCDADPCVLDDAPEPLPPVVATNPPVTEEPSTTRMTTTGPRQVFPPISLPFTDDQTVALTMILATVVALQCTALVVIGIWLIYRCTHRQRKIVITDMADFEKNPAAAAAAAAALAHIYHEHEHEPVSPDERFDKAPFRVSASVSSSSSSSASSSTLSSLTTTTTTTSSLPASLVMRHFAHHRGKPETLSKSSETESLFRSAADDTFDGLAANHGSRVSLLPRSTGRQNAAMRVTVVDGLHSSSDNAAARDVDAGYDEIALCRRNTNNNNNTVNRQKDTSGTSSEDVHNMGDDMGGEVKRSETNLTCLIFHFHQISSTAVALTRDFCISGAINMTALQRFCGLLPACKSAVAK
jgi:hypothetical protein